MILDSLPSAPDHLTRETFSRDLVDRVLGSLPSPETRRSYARSIQDLLEFAGKREITLSLLHKWRDRMAAKMTPGSVNVRVAAVRKLFHEAGRAGVISHAQAHELGEFKGLRRLGQTTGNWLVREQCRAILAVPNRRTLRGKRSYCVLALLLGCALRRTELSKLQFDQIQMREGRWVVADLRGKGNRIRTVAIPGWVKEAVDGWTKAAGITSGVLIRRLAPTPKNPVPGALSTKSLWDIVKKAGAAIGVPNFSPHDLRRTCAKLCRTRGGRIEQIQAMLGHASIATTERYLGSTQNLVHAVNDDMGLWS
jgi:integrase